MGLMTRLARLLRADAHTVLDGLEDPMAILRQALRDMEAVIHSDEALLAEFGQRAARLQDYRTRQVDVLAALAEQLQVCLVAGDDGLARTVIRRRLQAEQRLRTCTEKAVVLERQCDALTQELTHRRAVLADLHRQADGAEQLSQAQTVRFSDAGVQRTDDVCAEEVEVVLLAEKLRFTAASKAGGQHDA